MDMKIGKLNFKDYAAKKPLSVGPDGKFLTAADMVGRATADLRLGSSHALAADVQKKLTLERYKLEPEFKLGMVGRGEMTKAEIIENIKNDTEFGQLAVHVEMEYCNNLIDTLNAGNVVLWPKPIPVPLRPMPDWKPIKKCLLLKLPAHALFCENTTDTVIGPVAAYRIAHVHPQFAARGFTVVSLTGTNDVRANFIPQAKNQATRYLGGSGHGNVNVFTGYMNQSILQVGAYDPAEVKGKGIHFYTCLTGVQLAQDAVNHGARFYAGYTVSFTWVWDDSSTPGINEFELFMRSESTFDICMANGNTAQQAFDAAYQAFTAAMAQVPGSAAASWLMYDRDHLVLRGDPAAVILPYIYVKLCFPLSLVQQELVAAAGCPVE
jgi:hypothetical protein